MNLYYELFDDVRGQSFYFAQYNVSVTNNTRIQYDFPTMIQSRRVWKESRHGIVFYKNRIEDIKTAVVDLEEFLCIKLKAKPL
jgi:hypothetical protein